MTPLITRPMTRRLFTILCGVALGILHVAGPAATARAAEPVKMRLWPDGAPGATGDTDADQPFVQIWQADPEKATGSAFVICPGGGYGGLATDHEGKQVAEWCNRQGITAFVLHYRLGSKRPGHEGYHYPTQLLDVQRAIRVARAHAKTHGVDPARIGIFGFSAGGHLASMAATLFAERPAGGSDDAVDQVSCRPDLAVLAYPVIMMTAPSTHGGSRKNLLGPALHGPDGGEPLATQLSTNLRVTAGTPPTFIFQTDEDPAVPAENAVAFYLACRQHKVPAELHVYERGRHGVGLAPGEPVLSTWPDRLRDWLAKHGFLGG
jgi:acetyl esterase/lipase